MQILIQSGSSNNGSYITSFTAPYAAAAPPILSSTHYIYLLCHTASQQSLSLASLSTSMMPTSAPSMSTPTTRPTSRTTLRILSRASSPPLEQRGLSRRRSRSIQKTECSRMGRRVRYTIGRTEDTTHGAERLSVASDV